MTQASQPQRQDNIFNVHSLGYSSLPPDSPIGAASLQKSLLELYCKNIKGKKPLKLPTARLTLTSHGIIVAITKGKDEYFPLKDVCSCSALVFTGSKVKTNKKKSYTYLFDNIKPIQQQSLDQNLIQPPVQWSLLTTQKYLLKLKHHPLIACLLRRKNRPFEMHVFVCQSGEKALSFSYSVDMARRMEIEQPSPLQENYQTNNPFKQALQQANQVSMAEPELPEVIRRLEILGGGKGTVINPVVKTTNVNLINDNEFFRTPTSNYNYPNPRDNVKYEANNQDSKKTPVPQTRKSASSQQLNNLSVYRTESFEDFFSNNDDAYHKDKKRIAQPPTQLSIYASNQPSDHPSQQYSQVSRRKSQNIADLMEKHKSSKPAQRATTFMPRDLIDSDVTMTPFEDDMMMMIPGEGKTKPVAKVQPHKVTGVKVFPDGHDRTFLMPDRDRLRKIAQPLEDSESRNSPGNNYSNKNSPVNIYNNSDSPMSNYHSRNNSNKNSSARYYNNYNSHHNSDKGGSRSGQASKPPPFRSSPMQAVVPKNKNYLEVASTDDIINNNNNRNKSNSNVDNDKSRMERSEDKQFKDIWWSGDLAKRN